MRKPRLFYLAWTPPTTHGGACLAMHRHFVLRDDFDVYVASTSQFQDDRIPSFLIQRHPWMARISNTRFCREVRQFEMLVEPSWPLKKLEILIRDFKPDALFTIPDNTVSWSAYLLSKKMGIPLITNFQDWWPRGQFTLHLEKPYPFARDILEKRFRKMYAHSSIAFCTSAGMKAKLGDHSNAHVLYPCPAPKDASLQPTPTAPSVGRKLRIVYAGTIISSYGKSVLELAKALKDRPEFEFHVYGPPPDWSESDLTWMKEAGIYRGLVSYEVLKTKLMEADACLAVMSFEGRLRLMMETSFTTKFLEYSQYAKPILIWGPEYCQPIQIAKKAGAGMPITTPQVSAVVEALDSLKDPTTWTRYAEGALRASETFFNPDAIHQVLVAQVTRLMNRSGSW